MENADNTVMMLIIKDVENKDVVEYYKDIKPFTLAIEELLVFFL